MQMGSLKSYLGSVFYGMVIKRIWWQILLVSAYTTGVVYAYTHIPAFQRVGFKFNLIEILGIVTGLLLVFRTQIAYDRYWEGRNLWSKLGSIMGTLSRLIWISIKATDVQDVVEKKTIMNLLSAFPLATKHYLRDEYAHQYTEFKEYISVFPELLIKPATLDSNAKKNQANHVNGNEQQSPNFVAPSTASREILYYIGTYLDHICERDMIDRGAMRILQNSLSQLEDLLSNFEKILRTPMPLAYSLHLEHCLRIYVLAIPFQLVEEMRWWSIPVVSVASFAIIGILGIGAEIENPFGYDDNDLPLDTFCEEITNEIRLILSLKLPNLHDWVINENNYPCRYSSSLNAVQLVNSKSIREMYDLCRQDSFANPVTNSAEKCDNEPIAVVSSNEPDLKKY